MYVDVYVVACVARRRANEVRAVAEENRSKLEERGRKLASINDKAADLEVIDC